MLREEFCGSIDSNRLRLGAIKFVEPVVVFGWAEVPCIDTSRCPRLSSFRIFPDNCFGSWGGHGPFIKIVGSVELCVRGFRGIVSGGAEEVQRILCLFCEVIPELQWKILVRCAESTDEVGFKCLDCLFCRADAVVIWFDELPFAVFFVQVFLEGCYCLIVSSVQLRFETFLF